MGEIYWGEDITNTTVGEAAIDDDDFGVASDSSVDNPSFPSDIHDAYGAGTKDDDEGDITAPIRKPKDNDNKPVRTYSGKRVPISGIFTFAWGSAGALAERTEVDIPVGRIMQFQAPVAGEKFDELIAGTWLDKIIQPFLGKGENGKEIAAILAFPLVVGLVERQPDNPILAGIGMQMLKTNIRAAAPYFKEQAKEAKQDVAAMADISEIFEIPDGEDPLTYIWQQIFAVPPHLQKQNDGASTGS
jgi:hypothetical protein